MSKTPISLVIITLNEEQNIGRCIQSVSFVDDIVVLDSGSTDRTVAIAQSLGARVAVENWRGYHKQKVRATALARHPWVLSLDADEALSHESAKELEALIEEESFDKYDAYEFPRLSYHLGRWIRHGGWYPDRQVRLFQRERSGWGEGQLHERVDAKNVKRLKKPLLHWVFKDLADQVDTNNEYSTLGAVGLYEAGKTSYFLKLLFKPPIKFIECYIFKRGFLDGLPGFIIAVGAAYSIFLKFSKLWELKKLKNRKS